MYSRTFPKQLVRGSFMLLHGLPIETTEEQVREVFEQRTGIHLPENGICMAEGYTHEAAALISLDNQIWTQLLNWAFADDRIEGSPLRFKKYDPGARR